MNRIISTNGISWRVLLRSSCSLIVWTKCRSIFVGLHRSVAKNNGKSRWFRWVDANNHWGKTKVLQARWLFSKAHFSKTYLIMTHWIVDTVHSLACIIFNIIYICISIYIYICFLSFISPTSTYCISSNTSIMCSYTINIFRFLFSIIYIYPSQWSIGGQGWWFTIDRSSSTNPFSLLFRGDDHQPKSQINNQWLTNLCKWLALQYLYWG